MIIQVTLTSWWYSVLISPLTQVLTRSSISKIVSPSALVLTFLNYRNIHLQQQEEAVNFSLWMHGVWPTASRATPFGSSHFSLSVRAIFSLSPFELCLRGALFLICLRVSERSQITLPPFEFNPISQGS
ncbi:hypothetical protein RIF29_31680 [Crotalaria pallida]|uniref:Uncharacterized protein n=1 Tax=Crotalaria pallida TaxID=3830 RepID=A0AAN9EJP6_CROPI